MPSEFVYFKGKTKWFRAENPDTMFDPPRWKHVLYPDEESLKKFRLLQEKGIKNHLKKDDDGYFFNLSRPTFYEAKGRPVALNRPKVMNADGSEFVGQVGNGSDVTSKCEVRSYKLKTGKWGCSVRWDSSRIDNLVPYEPKRDFFDGEK